MRKSLPTREFRPPTLRADPDKYPNLQANPALERALRIRQAIDQGKPRDEAVQLAEQAMGAKGKAAPKRRPKAARRPASGPRPGGKAARARKKAAVSAPKARRRG